MPSRSPSIRSIFVGIKAGDQPYDLRDELSFLQGSWPPVATFRFATRPGTYLQALRTLSVSVATANLTNRFWIQSHIGSHLGSCLALVQLGESQGPNNDPNSLDSATEKLFSLLRLLRSVGL